MNRLFIPAAMTVIVAASLLSSCGKNPELPEPTQPGTQNSSVAAMLVGRWQTQEEGTDDNGNGRWDSSERGQIPLSDQIIFSMESNGTGALSGSSGGGTISEPITWALQNGNKDIRLVSNLSGSPDTSNLSILTLTATDLALADKSGMPLFFISFKKI